MAENIVRPWVPPPPRRELFRFNFPLMWIALMAEQEACRMVWKECAPRRGIRRGAREG